MTGMTVSKLLEVLEYDQSRFYKPLSVGFCSRYHRYRLAREAGFQGVYLFRTSEEREGNALFLGSADTPAEAREMHRKLWNLGRTPFAIMVLPHEIRVYSGFLYSAKSSRAGLLDTVPNGDFDLIRTSLQDFSAASIDRGHLWKKRALNETGRIHYKLLDNLGKLQAHLRQNGLKTETAHELIGKSIFLRYLLDRGIIHRNLLVKQGISLEAAFSRNATLKEYRRLFEYLDDRFNGNIFPVDLESEPINDWHVSMVAGILMGDEISDEAVQLHLDFQAYDFKFIAIETLSSIYERFLRNEDRPNGTGHHGEIRKNGIVYTPEFLADFLIAEMDVVNPLKIGMTVLDPACGSGVFLVLAYRLLIERFLQEKATETDPETLKMILTDSIYGVEREEGACQVAELSLVLTLLDYLSNSDLDAYPDFKFPKLRGRCIFKADFYDQDNVLWSRIRRYDWVLGNPPWTDLKGKNENEERPFRDWLARHGSKMPVGDKRISEGFLWSAPRLLTDDGITALVVHAKSFTNHKSQSFRKAFFAAHTLYRVANFANLRRVLFAGRAISPAMTLVYRPGVPDESDLFSHFGPFLANQTPYGASKNMWSLVISGNEIQTIPHRLIKTGDASVWKAALWGLCEMCLGNIHRIMRLYPMTLDGLCRDQGWSRPREGPQLRNLKEGKGLEVPQIKEGQLLRLCKKIKTHTFFSAYALESIPVTDFRLRSGSVETADRSISIHPSWTFQIFSKKKFVVRPRQINWGGPPESENHLRALTLYLNSSLVRYYLFFQVPDWGIERDRITLREIRGIPVPRMSGSQIDALATEHRTLVETERSQPFERERFRLEIDRLIEAVLDIPGYLARAARDFFEVRFTLNDGKTDSIAIRPPRRDQLIEYGKALASELDDFVGQDHIYHRVRLAPSQDGILCSVSLEKNTDPFPVLVQEARKKDRRIVSGLLEQHGQWTYIRRDLRVIEPNRIIIFRPSRLLYWTVSQATQDAGEILADMIEEAAEIQ